MRDWITINGRKLIWEDFVGILDYYRYKTVIRVKGREVSNRYNYMTYVLQELAYNYHEGSDYVLDHLEDFIKRHYMKMPIERRLPEALEELFNQMQDSLHLNLSEMLDECVVNSAKTYQHMQEMERQERERIALIQSLPVRNGNYGSRDVAEKVCYLINLQKAKIKCPEYEMKNQEIRVTSIWCELLILSLSADTITNGLMKRAVEDDILTEMDITGLLREKCHIDKDYEWYSEELLGCTLDEPTDIKIKDFLPLCETKFREILGIRESNNQK